MVTETCAECGKRFEYVRLYDDGPLVRLEDYSLARGEYYTVGWIDRVDEPTVICAECADKIYPQ